MTKTTIDTEQEGSDEAHDLKLLNVLMKCIEEAIEEGNLFDDDEEDDSTMRTMTMNGKTKITTVFVCVIPPILMQELAVVII